jgi:lipopolysaccharide export LptBFGC system permease protein LptF
MPIIVGFAYWTALGITSTLGRSALLPSVVAAWIPNFMFAMIAITVFPFGEER